MKLELKENMYVRTKDGYISQYKYYDYDIGEGLIGKLLCIPLSNGTFANQVNVLWVNKIVDCKPIHEDYNDPFYSFGWENDDIKSVITHEQMEQIAYKV